ncbi:MAG: hypothetical protein HY913_08855 [Desulfomonile tiedjei]|nr:hypothetical protein [Desulfomonile tiedjei]
MTSLILRVDSHTGPGLRSGVRGSNGTLGYSLNLWLLLFACLICLTFQTPSASFGQTDADDEPELTAPESTAPEAAQVTELKLDPERPETGSRLKAFIKMSGAVRAEVRWSLNGEEVDLVDYDGLSGHVDFAKPLRAGDKVAVAVTPFDVSQAPGNTATREVVCINAAPNLRLVKQEIVGYNYRAQVEAKDPENEPLELTIEGPPGMAIDPKGHVSWTIGTQTSGQFQIKVSAKDKEGATAILTYSIQIGRTRR